MTAEPWMIGHSIEIEIPFHDVGRMAADIWHGQMESVYAA